MAYRQFIYGSDQFAVKKFIEKEIKNLKKQEAFQQSEIQKFYLDETLFSDVLKASQVSDFFASAKIIVVFDFNAVASHKNKNEKIETEALKSYFEKQSDRIALFLVCSYQKLDQRLKLTKMITETCKVFEIKIPTKPKIAKYITAIIHQKQGTITEEALQALIEQLPLSFYVVYNEVNKLLIYDKNITLDHIKSLGVAYIESNIFDIGKAILEQNANLLLKAYKAWTIKDQNFSALIGYLQYVFSNLRNLLVLKRNNIDDYQIKQQLNLPYFVYNQYARAANSYNVFYLNELLLELATIEYKIKNTILYVKINFDSWIIKLIKHFK